MAEEHSCEAPEGHILCANNCGFFGSPATLNLCSKCYRDLQLKQQQASSAKLAVEKTLFGEPVFPSSYSSTSAIPLATPESVSSIKPTNPCNSLPPSVPSQPNRCASCRKRVGLTGFQCRCGTTFCSSHRYPEQHNCNFDFKSMGRETIFKENPVVKAQKLEKI